MRLVITATFLIAATGAQAMPRETCVKTLVAAYDAYEAVSVSIEQAQRQVIIYDRSGELDGNEKFQSAVSAAKDLISGADNLFTAHIDALHVYCAGLD